VVSRMSMSRCHATWRHPKHYLTCNRSRAWYPVLLQHHCEPPWVSGKGHAQPEHGKPLTPKERGGRHVLTNMLYGNVVEYLNISIEI